MPTASLHKAGQARSFDSPLSKTPKTLEPLPAKPRPAPAAIQAAIFRALNSGFEAKNHPLEIIGHTNRIGPGFAPPRAK